MSVKTLLFLSLIISPIIVFGQRIRRQPVPLGSSDTCGVTTAEKTYGGPSDDYANYIISASDSGYLLIGHTNSFGSGSNDGYVTKLDKLGVIQWSKTYGGPGDDQFGIGKKTADGGYILGGYTTSYGDLAGDAWLVKIDAAGNLLWSKKYGDGNPYGDRLSDVVQTADGGYAFCGDHQFTPGVVDIMVVRTDATGNVLWSKAFGSPGSDETYGICEDRDSLVVTAFYQSATGYDGVLMKLEETSGNIAWLNSWDFDSRTNRMGNIYLLPDGYMIGGVNSDGFGLSNPYEFVMKTDLNGNLNWVQELRTTPTTMNGYFYPTSDGGYIVENMEIMTDPNADIYLTKVAKDGTVEWSRSYAQPGEQLNGGIIPTPDGGYAGTGYTNQWGNFDVLLIKTDSIGQTDGCTSVPVTAANRNPTVTPLAYSWPSIYNVVFNSPLVISPTVADAGTADSLLCQKVNLCRHLNFGGPDSLCDWSSPVSYKAIRDSGCVSPVQWTIDNTYADVVTQTDSTVQLQFKQPGAVFLYGQIVTTCGILKDSLLIHTFQPTPLDLGPPASFCPGDSIVLNAGSGFQSYVWSTGDTTQKITVHGPGTYWVAAVNPGSQCLSRDTVDITVYPAPVVNIGPDVSICRDSVYKLDAGSGFSSYLWSDGSTGTSIMVNTPGQYWLQVTNTQGCTARDTVTITSISCPLPDTCKVITSENLYGGAGNDYSVGIISTPDGGYLVIGNTNSFGAGGLDGYVTKLDNQGAVQWSKTYGGAGDDEFSKVRQTSDGGYILGGFTTSFGDPAGDAWLLKINAAGNVLWSKKYGDGNPFGERLFDLIQTADGGYAFCGDHKYTPGVVDAMLVRVDATGNLLWAKGFDSGGSDESAGLNEDRDSLVVTAFYQSATGYDAVLMKIEEASGNIAWLKSWDFDSRTNRLGFVFPQSDGYMIMGGDADGYGVTNPWHISLKTDFNGNLNWIQELHTTPSTMNGWQLPTADGGYVVENDEIIFDPNADLHFTKVAKDGTVEWSRSYPQPGQQLQGGITLTPDGGYAGIAHTNQAGNFHLLLVKTDSLGQTNGCTSVTNTGNTRNPVVTPLTYNWPSVYDVTFNSSLAISPVVTGAATTDSSLCQPVDLCHHLKLTGPDSLCDWSSPVSYKAVRDSGCVTPVQWTIDNAYADIVAQTDSTVQLQFRQAGSVYLYGQILKTCGILKDSMLIHAFQTTPVDLGAPAPFCPGDSVVLNAGSGFQSYVWSTGDTTQQIAVHGQGTYWVAALNPGSQCLSTDTVDITVYPAPVVNLGPDVSICRDSVYKFDAGSGFRSYLWQDGSAFPVFYASQVGTYWVKVRDQNGCKASDTARIVSIQENPKDFLESVDQICSQGQLPLQVNAIGIWASYLWSDSSTGRSITVDAPGQYWLQVSTAAGCTARDTVMINGMACPLGIFFPGAFSPNNDGHNDVYRPQVYAVLDKFYMAIYDRWGVKVFETTDPYKGWDGKFNGQPQKEDTFVWYAQYRLRSEHGKETVKKGTFVLVR